MCLQLDLKKKEKNILKGSLSHPRSDIYGVKNATQGDNSKTKLSHSNLVICYEFSMLAGFALSSNKKPLRRVRQTQRTM